MNQNAEQAGAASYVMGFHEAVELLTSHLINYQNFLLELSSKLGAKKKDGKVVFPDDARLGDDERRHLNVLAQNFRYYAQLSFIKLRAIGSVVKGGVVNKKLEGLYEYLKTTLLFDESKAEEFVVLMNEQLASRWMKDLLESSQQLFNEFLEERTHEPANRG